MKMNLVFNYIKFRISWLNGIRLLLAVTFAGEGISSGNYWFLGLTLMFVYQITQNKICGPEGCSIPKK